MYEEIVRLIEVQLARLRQARALLAGSDEDLELQAMQEREVPGHPAPEPKPVGERIAAQEPPARRGPRAPKKPAAREGASLSPAAAAEVVLIPAAAMQKGKQTREETAAAPEPAVAGEGTLEALVQQLSREGKRLDAFSRATSFPFSLEKS